MRHLLFLTIAGLMLASPAIVVCATESIDDISDITDITDITVSDNNLDSTVSDNDLGGDSDNVLSDDFNAAESDPEFDNIQFGQLSEILFTLNDDIMLLNEYGGYSGAIPEPYYTYLKDCLSWSSPFDYYVAFVSSYYLDNRTYNYYVIAVSDTLSFSGSRFSGTDVDVYEFFPTSTSYSGYGTFRHTLQPTFGYSPGSQLCFTDLTSSYPDLRGLHNRYLFVMLCIFATIIAFYTLTKIIGYNVHFRRKPKRRVT